MTKEVMSREEALRQADEILEYMLRSGDRKIFDLVRDASGKVDVLRLAEAAASARGEIADKIQRGEM